ncbi:MAG: methyltransferase domain-containing protein [Acidobacteria bacterium]|nr:methyltransferase domain-containing protein [Acidobacteriota bacterium]
MERYRLYDGFAAFYNRYWGEYFLEDARAGVADALLARLPPGSRVLDLCCGTGQTAAWLLACGFEVVGVDGSEPMLRYARENATTAEFLCADAREFVLPQPVAGALATFDSMNHLPTLEGLRQVFERVFQALLPGGWFLFDINTHEGFEYAADETYAVTAADHVGIVRSLYDAATRTGTSWITLFEPAEGGLWARRDLEIPEYCHPTGQVVAAIEAAGFRKPRIFDATEDFGMPKAEGRLFLLTQRPT